MAVAKRNRPALQRQRRPSIGLGLPPDAPAEWRGTDSYVVIADYEPWFVGGSSSRVVRHYAAEADAIALAEAEAKRLGTHVRVELWPAKGRESVVAEFGGPSKALAEFAAERTAGGGLRGGQRSTCLAGAERDRRMRLVLAAIADTPAATDRLALALGFSRRGLDGTLAWGESHGLWTRNKYTHHWLPTAAGLAAAAGGPLP